MAKNDVPANQIPITAQPRLQSWSSRCHGVPHNAGTTGPGNEIDRRAGTSIEVAGTMLASRKEAGSRPHRKLVLCLLVTTIASTAIAWSTAQGTASKQKQVQFASAPSGGMPGLQVAGSAPPMLARLRHSPALAAGPTHNRSTVTELDGCLTLEGSMPKLTLFHSRRTYRLQPRANLQRDDPLVFAPINANTLVQVTGHLAMFVDAYDPDRSPVFIVHSLAKLAATCDVTVPLARLRQGLERSRTTAAPSASPAASPPVVNMTGELLVFEPPMITIRAGQTVKWTNSSREVHTVTADPRKATNAQDVELPKSARPFDSGYMNPGQTYSHLFRTPGTYRYVCTLHEVQRMIGQVIVKP